MGLFGKGEKGKSTKSRLAKDNVAQSKKSQDKAMVANLKANTLSIGLLSKMQPVAVLDIGSNSVRLVVYEHHGRTLTPLFNEKANCALGRGLAEKRKISSQNSQKALKVIARFGLVTKLMGVDKIYIIATSAVREASNGADFMVGVEMLMAAKGHILDGEEEAHFAARGIVFGMPDFCGLVGDLGGGSLEFSSVGSGKDLAEELPGETHELGVIRLQDASEFSVNKALKIAKKSLEKSRQLTSGKHEVFCAIGGTWRAFASLMQVRKNYPLHMVQSYEVSAEQVKLLALELVENSENVAGLDQVMRARRPLLAYGAAVLLGVLQNGSIKKIVFSSHGVREGYLFDRLSPGEAKKDPLIVASEEMCILRARSVVHAGELVDFTARFLQELGIKESASKQRLRHAACLLSDIGWRGHRDYRGEQSVDLVAYSALIGVDHPGRAFMAEILAVRYMGLKHTSSSQQLSELMGENAQYLARTIGAVTRLAYVLSGAMPQILPHIKFEVFDKKLVLAIPGEFSFLDSLRLKSRLGQLSEHLGYEQSQIRIF